MQNISNNVRTFLVVMIVSATALTFSVESAQATNHILPSVCHLSAGPGETLIDFGDARLRSDIGPVTNTKSVAIPAGKYKVSLEAFDGYEGRQTTNPIGQTQERYKVQFKSGSSTIATSGATADLQDLVREAYDRRVVNNSLTLGSAITSVVATHVLPIGDQWPNSVNPTCMLLEPIVNGVCNSNLDGKQLQSKPTSNLCTKGTASVVSGTGTTANPWKWSCGGLNGGSTDQCSATKKPDPIVCGNGKKESGEQCDDGNTNNHDGCSNQCVNETPKIDINKRDAKDKDDDQTVTQGETAFFEIIVKNTGQVDLKNVTVTDQKEPSCNRTIGDLAVGETKTYTCESTNVQEDFTNVAVVVGTPVNSTPVVTDTDPTKVDVFIPGTPKIAIEKRDAKDKDDIQVIEKGGDATFEIIVTNIGDVDLVNVKVTDPKTPACDQEIGDLKVGESKTYECTLKNVTQELTNVAFVVGTSTQDETEVEAEDPSDVDIEDEAPVCGNGIKESGEQCDDGNTNNTDSCSNQCTPNTPKEGPKCGNKVVESGEECDGGKNCTNDCKKKEKKRDCDSSIGNTIWIDTNGNGVQDPGEVGLSSVTVKLIDGNDVEKDNTNSSGRYKHDDLCKGTYTVVVDANDIPEGCYPVSDPDSKLDHKTKVKLGNDDDHTKADFGYRCPVAPATGPGAVVAAIASGFAATLAILYFAFVHPRVKRQDFSESIIG